MSKREKNPKPEQTSMALWKPTKALLDQVIVQRGQGARVKFWDLLAREQADRLGIPYRVNRHGIAEPLPAA